MRKPIPILAVATAAFSVAANTAVPVIQFADETRVTDMLLVGAFPHPYTANGEPQPGAPERGGFDTDWLAEFGGEAAPEFGGATEVAFAGSDGTKGAATLVVANQNTLPNFRGLMTPQEFGVAYAIADIVAAEAADATCWFGSDDYVKVWLNGELVHEIWETGGRSVKPGEDKFPVSFKAGANRLVVKIEQKWGGWGVDVEFLSEAALDARKQQQIERAKLRRFRDNELFLYDGEAMDTRGGILPFIKGKLPGVVFQNPELAAEMADTDSLKVRWFDGNSNEITDVKTQAGEPGFYCAYAELTAKNGMVMRRVKPVLFVRDFDRWRQGGLFFNKKTDYSWHDGIYPEVPEAAWNARGNLVRDTISAAWGHSMMYDLSPMLIAEISLDKEPVDAWRISHYPNLHDYFVKLRRKIYERPAAAELAPPVADESATALRFGTEEEAGFKAGAVAAIREAAQKWCDESGNGFVLLVARRGVVIMNEAFHGERDAESVDPDELTDGKLTAESRLPTASVTKLHCGVILGRCIDQGFVSLDDPVSKFFPDYPEGDPRTPTVRQLMNHTSGLDGHRWFMGLEGMANPFLENVAWWDSQTAPLPGTRNIYNGFGIDLGGKIVEDITGRSVFDVMRDGLFAPLGQDNPTIVDLGYGLTCTAMDLARVAEMLRQEGAYDGKRYFSRETHKLLLPFPLGAHNPAMAGEKYEYGVGISWMWDGPHESPILGKNVYGHGSATGAIFRVAPDHELVVTMARYTWGSGYDEGVTGLMTAIAEFGVNP